MQVPDSFPPHSQMLANGMRVTLRHAPDLARSAAVLRVAAASHDVPLAWPGLAHFLEHLFFLGTERFPAGQTLMAYVQRHGGQINARTAERTTEFFIELPPSAFAEGLDRLQDMISHPRLDPEDQLREREVLHAEFIAWSQDTAAQRQIALYEGLSPGHPLRAFHAGNRDSLAVPEPAFQEALHDFYQTFYQSGQMTLSLAGPQDLDTLKALAQQFANAMPAGEGVVRPAPPKLMASSQNCYHRDHEGCLDLLFALEELPSATPQALAFLCTCLENPKPGGLLATLRARGLADSLTAAPLYEYADQALLHLQFKLDNGQVPSGVEPLLRDWLGFFAAHDDWATLRQSFALRLQCRQQTETALHRARRDSEQRECPVSEQDLTRLREILKQLAPAKDAVEQWQLPSPNPFLQALSEPPRAGLIRGQTSAHRGLRTFAQDRSRGRREASPLQFSPALTDTTPAGAIYLRWQLPGEAPLDLPARLERHLHEIREDAQQAGVDVSFEAGGDQWLLKLVGLQAPMPKVLEHILARMEHPLSTTPAPHEAPLIPIRHLLKQLPISLRSDAAQRLDPHNLATIWTSARWDGLAMGLSAATQGLLGRAMARIPGIAALQAAPNTAPAGQRIWKTLRTHGDEPAMLLFCPAPSSSLADEAAWRLLAQLCQTSFYQRMRVELQLGYAVFSGLKQLNGQTGLLFGIQSPSAPAAQLIAHVEAFLASMPALIQQSDAASLAHQQQILADQFQLATMPLTQAAELLWQGKLAGRSATYVEELAQAITLIDHGQLLHAAAKLINAEAARTCLSNAPCPGAPWANG